MLRLIAANPDGQVRQGREFLEEYAAPRDVDCGFQGVPAVLAPLPEIAIRP